MVKTLIRAALVASAAAATTWFVKRSLDLRSHAEKHSTTKEMIRDWENEGGALPVRPQRALNRASSGAERY